MSEISIVITTFNSEKFIKPCLDSVFAQDYRDFDVIVVNNGSRDNTSSWVKENYSQCRLIENKKNLGAAKARNQGIEIARSQYILTLDCDVILEKSFLKRIMTFAENLEESVGSLQPKILKRDKKTIYSTGIYLSRLRRLFDIGKGKPDNGQFDCQRYIFGACSAAAFYKQQMLEEIKQATGYFDERFFFLVEDVDLSWRAQRGGWKALYCPEAVCYHLGNSSNTPKKTRQYLCFRNRYLLMLKNDSFTDIIKNLPFLIPYDGLRLFYMLFTNRLTLKGLEEVLRLSPKILKKRFKLLSRQIEVKAPS